MDGLCFLALLAAVIIPLGVYCLDDRPPKQGKK